MDKIYSIAIVGGSSDGGAWGEGGRGDDSPDCCLSAQYAYPCTESSSGIIGECTGGCHPQLQDSM